MRPLKIALVVPGRFHGFDLARALIERGHSVTILTNYPKGEAQRFGLPGNSVRGFVWHGIVQKLAEKLRGFGMPYPEALLCQWFGSWAARVIARESWDVVHCWSGISEELLTVAHDKKIPTLLMRGSSHIQTQSRILEEEVARSGISIDRPSRWIIDREKREYQTADKIVVLSQFARKSFLAEGVPEQKLLLLPLGADLKKFKHSHLALEERLRRLKTDEPLRVLYVGTLSFRKGIFDLLKIIQLCETGRFVFRLVGPVSAETRDIVRQLKTYTQTVQLVQAVPQSELPQHYDWADLFVLPTLEDGYALVLDQARTAALPILATENCGGPDFIIDGKNGWIFKIREPEAIAKRLKWCDEHRDDVAKMTLDINDRFQPRDWSNVASDFEQFCFRLI